MSYITDKEVKHNSLLKVAEEMLIAARTAPKARGVDNIEMAIVEKESLERIARKMEEIGKSLHLNAFIRDAANLYNTPVMVILGTHIKSIGLIKCGMCGFENCKEKDKHPSHPCVYNTNDLGIAVGSAVSVAMDKRVDNRIMYTAGQAILDLNIMGDGIKIAFGIPLSASSKNIYFDRK